MTNTTSTSVSYTFANGITVTGSREFIAQLRKERADYARELAAKSSKGKK